MQKRDFFLTVHKVRVWQTLDLQTGMGRYPNTSVGGGGTQLPVKTGARHTGQIPGIEPGRHAQGCNLKGDEKFEAELFLWSEGWSGVWWVG